MDCTINGIVGETTGVTEVGPFAPSYTEQRTEACTPAQPEAVVKEEPQDDGPPPPKRVRGFSVNEILEVEDDTNDEQKP
ncbi:hypothetical protein ANCCAN_22313 [Ancylostoma caninum]|uniref:Uncharacterized protein n=1 Tax=Ancylostoma caninum TaxID=29170 RepID=A0A368FI49_ANCCA|nr:hypothetical protein ANCCAN_22313 [Ancylostoma caninum]